MGSQARHRKEAEGSHPKLRRKLPAPAFPVPVQSAGLGVGQIRRQGTWLEAVGNVKEEQEMIDLRNYTDLIRQLVKEEDKKDPNW